MSGIQNNAEPRAERGIMDGFALTRLLKEATKRVDGCAMYFTLFAVSACAVYFASGYAPVSEEQRSRLLWGSVAMIPITVFFYHRLLVLSVGTDFSKRFNVLLLVTYPIWVYWALA